VDDDTMDAALAGGYMHACATQEYTTANKAHCALVNKPDVEVMQ